jgi:hypothetical protein
MCFPTQLFGEIEKDVSRTLPDYGFYSSETEDGQAHRQAIQQVIALLILMYGDAGWLSDCLRIRAGLNASSPVTAASVS